MKADYFLDSLEHIDAGLIERAGRIRQRKRKMRTGWAAAACLCLIIGGIALFRGAKAADEGARQWSASTTAEDYFKNSRNGAAQDPSSTAALVMPPYAVAVSLNDKRAELEAGGVLPAMPDHPEQWFEVRFNGDGSLYKVSFLWMRRSESGLDEYSDLWLEAAPREPHELGDVVDMSQPDSTVTRRDGVAILAVGGERQTKSLTWQTDQGWFRITGCWNDSYASLVALLDWFWEHPLDLDRFGTPPDGSMVFSVRAEQPEAFREQIPDFTALGYTAETELVSLGEVWLGADEPELIPVWFEGVYTRGDTRVRWTVSIAADADAWAACLGRPKEVTEESLSDALRQQDFVNLFFDRLYDPDAMATLRLEQGTDADAWELIRAVQK